MKKIGVYDSGMGGLSLLAKLVKDLPGHEYIYFGDSANAPYGVKTKEEIIDFARAAVDRLIGLGCEALVVACNTASSAAEEILKEEYDIPIFGMEPALDMAVEDGGRGKLLVMATNFTLTNPRFIKAKERSSSKREIISLAGPGLVLLVEAEITKGPQITKELEEISSGLDLEGLDGIVLGCTHFLFIEEEIRNFFGRDVKIYDSHSMTVDTIRKELGPGRGQTSYRFISSGGSRVEESFKWMMENYLQELG